MGCNPFLLDGFQQIEREIPLEPVFRLLARENSIFAFFGLGCRKRLLFELSPRTIKTHFDCARRCAEIPPNFLARQSLHVMHRQN